MELIKDLGVTSPNGFLSSGIHCGLKKNNKKDLALIYSEVPCVASGVYTKNLVKGAPLLVTKDHLKDNKAQAIIINSGNANTCNGENGLLDAENMTIMQGKELNLNPVDVLVASTGIIGVPLNINAIKDGIPALTSSLSKDTNHSASSAILTTDTFTKECSIKFYIHDKLVTLGSMAKGSGMIEPNMGTMLSFITSDINISPKMLQEALNESVNISYNRISVDGDTSTNDMVLILANGLSNNILIKEKDENYYKFLEALNLLNIYQAKNIARDGEGATKLIQCIVIGGNSINDCEVLSKTIIKSPLVKTAMFGSDANWGRVICALGYSGISFNPDKVDIYFKNSTGTLKVCENGVSIPFNENKAIEILSKDEITIYVDLKLGIESATCFGCDLSYDYVKINGDYRS